MNLFKRPDGRAFLPGEIINEIPASLPAFQGFDERGVSCPTATKDIEGDKYMALVKIKQNDALIFRKFNEGVETVEDAYEHREWGIKVAGSYVNMDLALYEQPGEAGVKAWEVAKQNVIQRMMRTFERQFFYGKPDLAKDSNIAKGFQGLKYCVHESMMMDAGGQGTELTSAYLVYFHRDFGVSWIQGNNGKMTFQDEKIDNVVDPKNPDRRFPVLSTFLQLYPGLACQGAFTVFRIANIDVSTAYKIKNKNRDAFTDEMIGTAIAMWPMNRPNVVFTTRKGAIMLGASRHASMIDKATSNEILISAGQTQSAKDCDGGTIPVCVTDGLVDNESKVTVK
ncbi:MAG: hypothetical protein FWC43_04765 [Planctomycetaceae bacterium]|nr:hypothetical protein [Planctomycetaceae bacterium]